MAARSIVKPETFTYLPHTRIAEIKRAAIAARQSLKEGDKETHNAIISAVNSSLTKHEKGMFCGFALSEAHHG